MQSDTLQQLKHDLKSQLKQANTTDSYNAFVKKSLDFFSVQKDINTMMRTALRTHKDVLMASYVSTSDSKRITDATRDIPYACHVHSITNRSVINEGIAAALKDPNNRDRVQWAKDETRQYCPWVKNYYCQSTPSVFDVPIEECLDMINVSDMSKDLLTSSVLHRIYFALHSAHNEAASPDVKNEYALLTGIERPQRAQLLLALCDMQAGGGFADMHKETLSPTKFREAWALTHCKKVQSQVEERGLQRLHDLISDLDEDNNPRYPILHKALVHGRVDLGNCFPKETESSYMWIRHIFGIVVSLIDVVYGILKMMDNRDPFHLLECLSRVVPCVFNLTTDTPRWDAIASIGIPGSRLLADGTTFLVANGTVDPNQHHILVYGIILFFFFLLDASTFSKARKRDIPLKALWNLGIVALYHVPAHIAGTYFMSHGYRLRDAFDFPSMGDKCIVAGPGIWTMASHLYYVKPNPNAGQVDVICALVTQATLWAMGSVKLAQNRTKHRGGAVYEVVNRFTPTWFADTVYQYNGDVVAQEKAITREIIRSSTNTTDTDRNLIIDAIDSEMVTSILVKSIVQNRPPDLTKPQIIPADKNHQVATASLNALRKMQEIIKKHMHEYKLLDMDVKKLIFVNGDSAKHSQSDDTFLLRKLMFFTPKLVLGDKYNQEDAEKNADDIIGDMMEIGSCLDFVANNTLTGAFNQTIDQNFIDSIKTMLIAANGEITSAAHTYNDKLRIFNHLLFVGEYLNAFQNNIPDDLDTKIQELTTNMAFEIARNVKSYSPDKKYDASAKLVSSSSMLHALNPESETGMKMMRAAEDVSRALFVAQTWNDIGPWYAILERRALTSPVFGMANMIEHDENNSNEKIVNILKSMKRLSPFAVDGTMSRMLDRATKESATRYKQSLFFGDNYNSNFVNSNFVDTEGDKHNIGLYHQRIMHAARKGTESPLDFFRQASDHFRNNMLKEKYDIDFIKNALKANDELLAYSLVHYIIELITLEEKLINAEMTEVYIFFKQCNERAKININTIRPALHFAIEFFGVHAKDMSLSLKEDTYDVLNAVDFILKVAKTVYGDKLAIDPNIFIVKENVNKGDGTKMNSRIAFWIVEWFNSYFRDSAKAQEEGA